MIWCKNFTLLAFVLVLSVSSNALSQDKKTTVATEAPQDEDTIDLTPPAVLSTEKDEDERGAGQIVGQSLVPQLLGQSFLPRPLNLFSAMFPALNSLLLMGNMFPAASLLGTPSLLGSTHQLGSAQNDEVPADSKVVLVLAEDRNPHAAMRAAHQEAARTIRQNDMFSQLLAQFGQADFSQMLSQSLEQMQQQNSNPLLQQFVPQEFSQTMGQLLSQTFQQFPGLDLSQFPMLGQPPPSADPSGDSTLPEGEGVAAPSAGDAAPPTPGFQFPNFQSAIDAGTQLLGQAFQQPTGDPSSGFQLPNFQSALDASSQMLGQAFQQANGDAVNGFQLPNFQSVIDTGNQMLTQSGSLFNLRPLQSLDTSASASDAEPAASQISEVRVKPDTISSDHSSAYEMQKDVNMDELKMTSALQQALLHKKLPILWFRIPTDSLEKDHDLETTSNASKLKNVDEKQLQTKLEAFQRQVITELKLLQDIERQAKEMRAASMGATSKTLKDNANNQSSMLSTIPIHKITRSDIEKALNDDYVKKLLHKAAIANRKEAGKMTIYTPSGINTKRQTSKSKITPRQMTRDDIVRMMAYAYRMANANGIRMLENPQNKKPSTNPESDGNQASGDTSKATERKWPSGAKASMERQWLDEERQIPDAKTFQQDSTLMDAGRQMQQNMGRQWLDEQKPTHTNQPQAQPILEHHRQALEDNPQMNSQRQWVDHKSDMLNWMQENSQMPMQRQWADNPSMPPMPSQTADGRMWAEQQPQVAMQQPMMMPQMSMPMMQQPQMVAQQIPMELQQMPMQQPQMVAQQIPMDLQQMPMQQPQMVAKQIPMNMQQMPMQQPQMVAQQIPMEMQQMPMQQPQMVAQQIPMEMQQMPMQQPQMVAQHTPMELQHMPMMMQQPQMVAQHTPMGQMPMMMQQPRMEMKEPPMLMQHIPMMTQQPQGELAQMGAQGDTMMLQQMSPDMQRQTHEQDTVGEAMPQMPENTGKARFKGGSIFDELDLFGLGGGGVDKKKKLKEPKPALRPTIINYYYNGGRPATYGSGGYSGGSVSYGSSSKPSYGASYGGGAGGGYGGSVPSYGASAGVSYNSAGYAAPNTGSYRTAVGDDEIMALLQEHTHMKMMSDSDRNPVTNAVVPTTTTYQTTTMATEDNKQKHLSLQAETSSIRNKPNSTITSTVVPPTTTSSKLSRLDCKLRQNSILGKGKTYKADCVRHKRNANYGTLQAIDANSLSELRKTYKDSLKEITLNPEEDPAEALTRYNAASIRAALEQANQAPMEVSTHDEGASTIETHNNEAYYDGAHMPVLNQIQAHPHALPEPNLYVANQHSPHNNYKILANMVRESANVVPQIRQQEIEEHRSDKPHEHEREYKILIRKQDHIKPIDNKNFSPVIIDSDLPQHTNASNASETHTAAPGSSESELRAVLELIKQQMQTCCDKCRDRILGNIKANIKELHSHESLQKENPLYNEAVREHSKTAVSALKSNSKRWRDDEQFEKWLREMEAKGYESKYLTKSHHWQYLNSGKLALAVESNEYDQQIDNKVTKKTNEQSFKRFTPPSLPMHGEERKSKKLNLSNKSKGKAFGKKLPEINYSIKEHVHVVNDELRHLKPYSEEVTPSPYAMRGKFKSSSAKRLSDSTAMTIPVKFNAMSQQRSPLDNIADENKAKVVELLSLLYDLRPHTESTTNSKPTQLSVVVMPIVPATSTTSPDQVATTIRARTKRMRSRRKQKVENDAPTKVEQSSVDKDVPTIIISRISSSSVNPETSSPMDPENVSSFFSFSPIILTPFMELQSVPLYESDPWNHKSFDLHHPLYEGGGSYEPYLNSKRLKRKAYGYTNNILTPSILEHFLKVRVQFEKSFPQLYKSVRDQQRALNLTRVYVKPPVIPKEVMYPPTELGAAELLPLDLSSTQIIEPKAKSEDVIDYVLFDDDD